MKYMTVSEARKNVLGVAEEPEQTVLTRNGKPVAVLMPIREYRAMRAMMKLYARSELAEQVLRDHLRVQRGDLDGFIEIESARGATAF